MSRPKLVLVLDNVRSTHNVGSIMRSAAALGAHGVWCAGITPYPQQANDARLPHVAVKAGRDIAKTALGAERMIEVKYFASTDQAIAAAIAEGYDIWALEQAPKSVSLTDVKPPTKLALIVGHERDGVNDQILKQASSIVEIPLPGHKESLNVSVAAAIALYHLLAD